ncbi:uncharacterized protein B0H18DRAFT_1116572 [Fomitopsis serialis]|uniref:uncharacterized protein n=1 Tax=Fomitopsis serialis TaxID=139415 RepID=UPI002007BD52|nr:uncharacterized protein B0H18DRAFT_1116572 [Neoantrodia serialis]KAH9930864.1 hypothetical protein B0H18DRAFT_1116572 [Neoantrodia serialis]
MDYFDFNMKLPAEWATDDEAGTEPIAQTPVGTPMERPATGSSSGHVTVSVSHAFHPYTSFDDLVPDIILVSPDQVFFYVHHHKPAEILNIILTTVYGLSAKEYQPSFETISTALDALARYGLEPKRYASVKMPLYDLVVACAPLRSIDTYALAAAHDLPDVATAASAHLLPFPLTMISDELAMRIGSVYLKKLFFLHFGRIEALKHLLLHPPSTHPDTPECSAAQQQCLTRSWALVAAHIMWEAGPNLSTYLLQAALLPLQKELTCSECRLALRDRIARLVVGWACVKRTI